jgi:hypothetical protein
MSDSPTHPVRSATTAGIAFTITDLEVANALMKMALSTQDEALVQRTCNHASRTLDEARELLLRAPAGDQRQQLTEALALLTARLANFRARGA